MFGEVGEVYDECSSIKAGRAPAINDLHEAGRVTEQGSESFPMHNLAYVSYLENRRICGQLGELENAYQYTKRHQGRCGRTNQLNDEQIGKAWKELIDDIGSLEI